MKYGILVAVLASAIHAVAASSDVVANAILPTTVTHVNKYGETSVEITGVKTNGCSSLAEAIAATQVSGCSAKSGTGIAVCGMELLRETA